MLVMQQRLEATENLLSERERELASAQEKMSSLSDDLIASQGKVGKCGLEKSNCVLSVYPLLCLLVNSANLLVCKK